MTWKSASLLTLALTLGCGSSASQVAAQSAPPPMPPAVTPISAATSEAHRSAWIANPNQETNDRIAKQSRAPSRVTRTSPRSRSSRTFSR